MILDTRHPPQNPRYIVILRNMPFVPFIHQLSTWLMVHSGTLKEKINYS